MALDRIGTFMLFIVIILACVFGYMVGYDSGKRDVLAEAVEVGAAEKVENYRTMNYDIRWITVDHEHNRRN